MTAPTTPTVELIGTDGNAFAILGKCHRAAYRAGWTREEVDAFTESATSGDYDHLLSVVLSHFEVD